MPAPFVFGLIRGSAFRWTRLPLSLASELSWKPFGSQSTVVRGGYAIYHDSSWNQGAQGLWENPPYFAESDNFIGPCPFNNAGSATPQNCGNRYLFLQPDPNTGALVPITTPPSPQSFPGTLQSQNLDFKQGRVQQFNVNVERQIPGNIVLTAGYAGSRSSHILVDGLNLNVGSPACMRTSSRGYTLGCGPGGATFGPKWGTPTFAGTPVVANSNDVGRAHYNSFQVKAETKSAKHGIYALIGYTYSQNLRFGYARRFGHVPRRYLLSAAGHKQSRLELVSAQRRSPVHCERDLQPALWERQGVRIKLERARECRSWQLGGRCD